MRQLTATKLLIIADVLSGWHLISASAGPDGAPVFLAAEHPPESRTGPGGKGPKRRTRLPLAYRIIVPHSNDVTVIDLPPTQERLSFAQPLGPEQWLAAPPRSSGASNVSISSKDGQRLRSLHLGDAIEDIQTTRSGHIWASYFDEGVFGDDALGQEGAICFSQDGQPMFRYNQLAEQQGFPFIADCYAMNVCSDEETWLYLYTDFPLVRIVQGQVKQVWHTIPVHGAHAFAIAEPLALFAGGYHKRQSLFLVRLDTNAVEEMQPVTDEGAPIAMVTAFGRGSRLYLRDEQSLFSIDLAQLEAW